MKTTKQKLIVPVLALATGLGMSHPARAFEVLFTISYLPFLASASDQQGRYKQEVILEAREDALNFLADGEVTPRLTNALNVMREAKSVYAQSQGQIYDIASESDELIAYEIVQMPIH